MALDTYAGLKTSIQDHLDRDDLMQYVDDFIDVAEAKHKRDVRIREMLSRTTLSIASAARYVNLPSDFLAIKYLRVQNPENGPARYLPPLVQLTEDKMVEKSTTCDQAPRFYTINDQIEFQAEADQAYTGEIFYYTELTALSDSNTSNAILARAADVYLYGALAASAPFLLNDERIPVWKGLYESAVADLNESQLASVRSGPQVSKVSGVV